MRDIPVIETRGLSKAYGPVSALKSMDLRVPERSIFGLLGPNGAGKTTAIKLFLGLARPSAGSGAIFGCDIVRQGMEIRRRIGYLAQDPRYYERMTARENLRFTIRFFFKGPRRKIEERIEETLALVGLEGKADRPVGGLSGGELRRLGIAQAQVNHPHLLILDEPTAGLDPTGRRDVLRVVARLRECSTILYSTCLLEDVQRVSDVVGILNRGVVVAQAPIQHFLASGGEAAYRLQTRGDIGRIGPIVASQPWVTDIKVEQADGQATWRIAVSNPAVAEGQLLRLVMAVPGVRVTGFGWLQAGLEDVLQDLGSGDGHGR